MLFINQLDQEKIIALKEDRSIVGFATVPSREKFAKKLIELRFAKGYTQDMLALSANIEVLFIQLLEGCILLDFIMERYNSIIRALECTEDDLPISGAFWLYED
jgi:hypothetical protein